MFNKYFLFEVGQIINFFKFFLTEANWRRGLARQAHNLKVPRSKLGFATFCFYRYLNSQPRDFKTWNFPSRFSTHWATRVDTLCSGSQGSNQTAYAFSNIRKKNPANRNRTSDLEISVLQNLQHPALPTELQAEHDIPITNLIIPITNLIIPMTNQTMVRGQNRF